MRKKIKIGILFLTILSVVSVSGCGKNKKGKSEVEISTKFELNERQIKILEEAELPTDYDELGIKQKSAIERIEKMLAYLENKYGKTFCYDGYGNEPFETEFLEAYEEGDSEKRIITVYRTSENGKDIYEDDYQNILAEKDYKDALKKFINHYLDKDDYKLFVDIDEVEEKWTKSSVIESVSSENYIFINNNATKDLNIEDMIKDFGVWMQKRTNQQPSVTGFITQDEDAYYETEEYSYIDQINSREYLDYINCSLSGYGRGEVEIEVVE